MVASFPGSSSSTSVILTGSKVILHTLAEEGEPGNEARRMDGWREGERKEGMRKRGRANGMREREGEMDNEVNQNGW